MIIAGIILLSVGVLFINYIAITYILRLISVNKRTTITEGKIVDFDNRHILTIEYNVNGIIYRERCGVMFVKPFSSDIINGSEKIHYSVGDVVQVRYDNNNPKIFLIDGASAFYKFRTALIFFLDIAIIFLAAICAYIVYLQEIGILK